MKEINKKLKLLKYLAAVIFLLVFFFFFKQEANAQININFGINNLNPWMQTKDADLRIESQTPLTINVPGTPGDGEYCGTPAYSNTYVSLQGAGGTPGIVFSGENDYDFGSGLASIETTDPKYGWVVGNDTAAGYNPQLTRKTSYNYIYSKAKQGGLTPIDLTVNHCGAGGLANCDLNSDLAHGLYIANGDLTLNSASIYTFGNSQNYVILVNGDLVIANKIKVPVGSTVIFVVKGDITVESTVGEADMTSTASDIEGIFSADGSFILEGNNNCGNKIADLRLNLAGNIVVGAGGDGEFINNRDLCEGNALCPVFFIIGRPDFILNLPTLMRYSNYIWQEVAP